MIPKFSQPMSKLIRTTEGVLIALFNVAALAAVIVNDVSPVTALKYAGIVNTITLISRQFLKAVAVVKPSVGGDPITPQVGGISVDSVLAEIDAVEQAVKVVQAKPGTPAGEVKTGLSPSPEPSNLAPQQVTGTNIDPSIGAVVVPGPAVTP